HIGDEMTLLSGAVKTIAFNGNDEIIHPAMRMKNDRYYTSLVRTEDHVPEKAKYQVLLKALGISDDNVEEEPTIKDHARFVTENPQSIPGKPYVVIGPGGSAEIRRWPAARFASVANALESPFIVLCGSSQERSLLEEIAGQMKQKPMVMAGYPIQTIAQVIKSAQLFLGNESGLLHLAASFGTRAIGILGGGHFARYFPYGSVRIVSHKLPCYECNWKCPYPEPYCITNITVGDVLKEIESLDLLESPVIK
ncbi:MAG TPA: glycosyltransferase family 9 protein, partial [Bacteroidota bacterium]|nr:glycosyltransferase family 9 protein [Bacteroidota bacterium]